MYVVYLQVGHQEKNRHASSHLYGSLGLITLYQSTPCPLSPHFVTFTLYLKTLTNLDAFRSHLDAFRSHLDTFIQFTARVINVVVRSLRLARGIMDIIYRTLCRLIEPLVLSLLAGRLGQIG